MLFLLSIPFRLLSILIRLLFEFLEKEISRGRNRRNFQNPRKLFKKKGATEVNSVQYKIEKTLRKNRVHRS